MSGFQTAARPRPLFSTNRPPAPVVPFARVGRDANGKVSVAIPEEAKSLVELYREIRMLPKHPVLQPYAKARQIVESVAAAHNTTPEHIYGEARQKHIVEARRHAISLVSRANPGWSLPKLGRFFCRDHTTIHHALKKTGDR